MSVATATPLDVPNKKKSEEYILTAHDRCDHSACGAQAWFIVTFMSGNELYFCKHHFAKNEIAMAPVMDHDKLVDESHRLEQNKLVDDDVQ